MVISGASDAVRRAVSTVRIVMAEGDGPPGPWSDRGAAREVRRGEMGGDFVEETVPCTGLGPGRVIGKRGATVNRLQDETGARIEVRAEDGRCFVSGTSEQVTAAVEAVRRIIEEGDGYVPVGYDANGVFEGFDPARARGGGGGAGAVEETVQFRSELEVGRIIGKGGATVRHIEDETGVRIQVDKRLMECVVTGGPEEVRRAVRMCERVAEEGFGGAVRVVRGTGAEGAVIGPGANACDASPRRPKRASTSRRWTSTRASASSEGRRMPSPPPPTSSSDSSRRNGGKTREDGPTDAR